MTVTGNSPPLYSFSEGYKIERCFSPIYLQLTRTCKVPFVYMEGWGEGRRKRVNKKPEVQNKDTELYLGQPPAPG